MKCMNCNVEDVETDDNFCWNCGHWTARGYNFLKDETNRKMIENGKVIKQNLKVGVLVSLLLIGIITFIIMYSIQGKELFLPFKYLKKQVDNMVYGYNTSIIKTDNKYNKVSINDYNDAINIIKKDFNEQAYICDQDLELSQIEYEIETNYAIPKVSFCDIKIEEAQKIKRVIDDMYTLFPNIKGGLTNITITNANTNSEYIARFQPMYQFVNINDDINDYNKVNKTQILLNSYYFLNDKMLEQPITSVVEDNWYVKDATWESTIAHELGHYVSFVIYLKEHNLNNITFITKSNYEKIDNLLKEFESNNFSLNIVKDALSNYNSKNNTNLDLIEFAKTISTYAGTTDKNNELIADETIAEAVHDYYLHKNNMQKSSYEIITILKSRLEKL